MARLLRTTSLGTSVTRQDLYDLINKSGLTDVGVTVTGVGSIVASTATPSAFTATNWWFDQEHQVLRVPISNVGGSACSLWLSVGPDSWEVPVYNNSANVLAWGMLVSWSTAANPGIYDITPTIPYSCASSASYVARIDTLRMSVNLRNAVGALQATLAANSWGRAVFRGNGYLLQNDILASNLGNRGVGMAMATAYTGTAVHCSTTPGMEPSMFAMSICHPATSFPSMNLLMPAFIFLPFGSSVGA